MLRVSSVFAVLLSVVTLQAAWADMRTVWMDDLDLSAVRQGWGTPQPRHSVVSQPLCLAGKTYERGVGSHARGEIYVALDGKATRFQAAVGVDDETRGRGSVTLRVYGDDNCLLASDVLRPGVPPLVIDLDITGMRNLVLLMGDGADDMNYDHFDWADARFLVEGADPKVISAPSEEKVILTPRPPDEPRINGPRVYGVRPGSPFLFRIPATGKRPMRFTVRELPAGLAVDAESGIISGVIADSARKTYRATLVAENDLASAEREFRIVVGDTLALTPPMGYNHWYAHYFRVTDAMMRQAADVMIASGMADVGYQYVNIDDCWMNAPKCPDATRVGPLRDENGELIPNQHFPDMQGLADYIHAKGLKAGLYTSPGPLTCAGYAGAYEHEEQDAALFAQWGFDFLKYDWCSYGEIAKDSSLPELQKPYIKMGEILKKQKRDIVFNLCQYGMGNVWEWGEQVGGNCWRTAGDLGFELVRYHQVAKRNAEWREFARPGAWNDPDYLQIGYVGNAADGGLPQPCPLTPSEQYSYMSLWCLMAAPLVYSGDMAQLDDFTLNVLCNPEVIEIDQDPLGKQGYPVAETPEQGIWKKELEDGSVAIGLFNTSPVASTVTARWKDIGLTGKQRVRDLWRQKDLGTFENEFGAPIGRHGVVLLRLWPAG